MGRQFIWNNQINHIQTHLTNINYTCIIHLHIYCNTSRKCGNIIFKKMCFFFNLEENKLHMCAHLMFITWTQLWSAADNYKKQWYLFNEIYLNLTSIYKFKCLIKVKQHCVMIFFLVVFIETYREASRTVSSFIQHVTT